MNNTNVVDSGNEQEISSQDLIVTLIRTLISYRKILYAGMIVGIIIAISGTLLFGKYQAQGTISNLSNFDYLMWIGLKRNLPLLAETRMKSGKGDNSLSQVSDENWWKKNVVPTFAVSKDDNKDAFGLTLKEGEATKIKDIVIKTKGESKEKALENLSVATSFLQSGATYLALKELVNSYQIQLRNSQTNLEKNSLELDIEASYLEKRIVKLESLKTKFPVSAGAMNNQVVDLKDGAAKFMPISVQLIAANQDLNVNRESKSRLNDEKQRVSILAKFLDQANPVIEKNLDGLSAIDALNQIVTQLRKDINSSDLNGISMLNSIKDSLNSISVKFIEGISKPSYVTATRPHYLKNSAIGFALGLMLSLIGLVFYSFWNKFRSAITTN